MLVTLKNSGTSTLYLRSVSLDGQLFAQANDCGASLSPGQTCAITVRYNGPTSISQLNILKDTIYTGQLSVEESISATFEAPATQHAQLQAVLPKATG